MENFKESPSDVAGASMHPIVTGLPPNVPSLLRALNAEFYGGPLADADAFRWLPIIADAIERDGKRITDNDAAVADAMREFIKVAHGLTIRHSNRGDDTEGEPIGWKIVAIGNNGSVLCEAPNGRRVRYLFTEKTS
jgi:hypothetical protein